MNEEAIEQYLSALPKEQEQICRQLHKTVLKNMPGTIPMIAHSALGYATSPSSFDRIVYIAPQNGWVNLGFFFGADLPDAEHMINGQGKRMRHIKIRTLQEAKNPALQPILQAAWAKAPTDIESIHKRKKTKQ